MFEGPFPGAGVCLHSNRSVAAFSLAQYFLLHSIHVLVSRPEFRTPFPAISVL
ncbi:unnamed protein product [Gulo gulo]|uniref:Uncharacterized protein n=1 Tax=Gulo gulo TaxID=48420 RepID=A0A9X9QAU8_GULGU|nr:unnamed protein product [Gulo gulo]